ncbi:hypothetical protein NM688_g7701 [Phlebia brevispora]|uniref:Uncharacterized protein n=1 Tax=Phlebia brevispora TaxID=194682 RepID=A0ACC1S2L8_9APHY|nr:hypothetical protein NM688_g7701 [Phlebia brevispora]
MSLRKALSRHMVVPYRWAHVSISSLQAFRIYGPVTAANVGVTYMRMPHHDTCCNETSRRCYPDSFTAVPSLPPAVDTSALTPVCGDIGRHTTGLTNDLLTTLMASDPSAYPLPHLLGGAASHTNKNLTPAEAIAEAWQRESEESKRRWREADTRRKQQFYAPHPWSSVGGMRVGPKIRVRPRPTVQAYTIEAAILSNLISAYYYLIYPHVAALKTFEMSKTAQDLIAGTAGGIAQVLVGQPFDIVKVRMQSAPKGTYSGMVQCAGGILRNEGPLAFYKGTLTPLLGIGVCVSIQFGAMEFSKRVFASRNIADGIGGPNGAMLTGPQLFASGVFAGLANSVVSGPVEHIRIRLQIQTDKNRLYAGPWDAIKKIYAKKGIAGIYKGQIITLWREASGYGIYFWAYEKLMQREMAKKGIKRDEVNPLNAVLYGAAAGYALWAIIYPIDMIKTRMQTDAFLPSEGQKYKSTLHCVRTVWRTEGPAAFVRGLSPTLIRSPFANGATFLGFELANRFMNSLAHEDRELYP